MGVTRIGAIDGDVEQHRHRNLQEGLGIAIALDLEPVTEVERGANVGSVHRARQANGIPCAFEPEPCVRVEGDAYVVGSGQVGKLAQGGQSCEHDHGIGFHEAQLPSMAMWK